MRSLLRLVGIFLALLVLAAGGGYVYLRQSLPQWQGEIEVHGVAAPVEILRDRFGVPHIFAQSEADAHFALGFVHAQDRLWQLEMNRRIGAGRLAEVLGRGGLPADRFMRTLGLRHVAAENLAHLDAGTRGHLEAYAAGVNAFVAADPVLPPEFLLLRLRFAPWAPVDSLTWLKVMAWDLGGNWRNELLRLQLSRTLPAERIAEFLPPAAPDLRERYPSKELPRVTNSGSDPDFVAGSNSWAVAKGSRGKPLLANDPHLGLTAPPVWYLAHLNAPGLEVIGGTLPGLPGVLVGRNARLAWGFTNAGVDVQDLYLERLDAPFKVREEIIAVKGEPAERLQVHVSRHGPVLSAVSPRALAATPRGHALALAWTALAPDDRTLQAALAVGRAHDWRSFLAAARDLHAPPQAITYADVDGHIGTLLAGRVPRRKSANDLQGLAPAPGWDARYDWAGFLPFEALPRELDPPSGRVVLANHRFVPAHYPHFLAAEWQPPYRAQRIEALLDRPGAHSVAGFARLQLDAVSLPMRALLPRLLAVPTRDENSKKAVALLAGWDGTMAAGRPEPLLAVAWWRELSRALYGDELGSAFDTHWGPRAPFLLQALKDESPWCDDVRTPAAESCDARLAEALERALLDLQKRYGPDMEAWKWGEAHAALHRHRPLSSTRFASLVEIAVPTPGDAYTVNAGRSDFADEKAPFASRHAASYRAIYDLADPQGSLFIHSGGQSGNPLSSHYQAFSAPWARGEYIPMVTDRYRLEAEGAARLVLRPRR